MIYRFCTVLLLVLLVSHETRSEIAAPPAFEETWRLVQTEFYDPTLRNLNWAEVADKYRPLAAAASSVQEQSAVINRMLGELGASHTAHFTRDEIAYYDLFDIFSGALRRDRERLFPGGRVAYVGIGAITKKIDGKTFITGILDGFPASQAGLERGDEVLSADGAPYHAIGSFRGKAGQPVKLTIRRSAAAEPETVTVTPEEIRPAQAYLDAMRNSTRVIDKNGVKIGYIHVWSYAGDQYQELLEKELSSGNLASADALVWDLRDGWGGAQLSYLDVFDRQGPTMSIVRRNGEPELIGFRWQKPVAMLVNGGTRSGKEILAYGMKAQHYGEVVGTHTAGAVLAGRAFILSDNSLLLLAVADVLVDGQRLERVGVEPTVVVPQELEYSAGRDPQLERALELLSQAIKS
jgi:C-terminal processing protease CtpA/Prc